MPVISLRCKDGVVSEGCSFRVSTAARHGLNQVLTWDIQTKNMATTNALYWPGTREERQALLAAITSALDPGSEPTDGDDAHMDALAAELEAFVGDVKAGRA